MNTHLPHSLLYVIQLIDDLNQACLQIIASKLHIAYQYT